MTEDPSILADVGIVLVSHVVCGLGVAFLLSLEREGSEHFFMRKQGETGARRLGKVFAVVLALVPTLVVWYGWKAYRVVRSGRVTEWLTTERGL